MNGKVYLVGAGPGDPELITVKGIKLLKEAQVVVYDRLISPELLKYVNPSAELYYAGKAPGRHSLNQEEINELLVKKAREGKMVVRLKGGDPFVFGRGGEEALALFKAGIPFEVVPGVTSAVAVPAYAGIPVTHRRIASSFTVVTGNETENKEEREVNWEKIARVGGTIVILMGLSNLPFIKGELLQYLPATTPVAVIYRGTTPSQKVVTGTLEDIVEKVLAAGIKHPAVIVVGDVVKLHGELGWYSPSAVTE